eukprot:TRINITY_DN15604_c0_g1_i1.p1 TRINITY_DN15604_c0_g1~~TRINITY_DN15604_c0_g1_i1.p1  ORF type:complete len:625 (+),score=72.22 TRINITY_DN15604_c0_g1_i1:178-2052(+)
MSRGFVALQPQAAALRLRHASIQPHPHGHAQILPSTLFSLPAPALEDDAMSACGNGSPILVKACAAYLSLHVAHRRWNRRRRHAVLCEVPRGLRSHLLQHGSPRRSPSAIVCRVASGEVATCPSDSMDGFVEHILRLLREDFNLASDMEMSMQLPSVAACCDEAMRCLRSGDGEGAKRTLAAALLEDPLDVDALFHMALYFEVTHQPAKALRWLETVLEAEPRHVSAWVLKGKCLEQEGFLQDALDMYDTALHYRRRNRWAAKRRSDLLENQRVHITPEGGAWDDAEMLEGCLEAMGDTALPAWQENVVHPDEDSETPPAQELLGGGVMAWDNVLSEGLLSELASCVDDFSSFASTNGWLNDGRDGRAAPAATFWLPGSAEPASAPEVAARSILQHVLGEEPDAFVGVEYWGRARSVNMGAVMHYDRSESSEDVQGEWTQGNPWRPEWSSVLYLTDEGGPTVILDQCQGEEGPIMPYVPRRGHFSMPRRNRLVVFRADLFHGTLPVDVWADSPSVRKVFVFNFWRRHVPEAPHCQRIDLHMHAAMKRHFKALSEVQGLQQAESVASASRTPVERSTYDSLEALPHSSDFGFLAGPLPMPSIQQLQQCSLSRIDWAVAASKVLSM